MTVGRGCDFLNSLLDKCNFRPDVIRQRFYGFSGGGQTANEGWLRIALVGVCCALTWVALPVAMIIKSHLKYHFFVAYFRVLLENTTHQNLLSVSPKIYVDKY